MGMVYDLPTVEAHAQPMQRFEATEVKNFAAEQGIQQGQSVTAMGNAATKIIRNYENDVAEAATRERVNKLVSSYEDLLSNPENGYLAMNGKAAVDKYKDAEKSIKDISQKIGETATTDLEKVMYGKIAAKYSLEARQKVFTHALNQGKVWNIEEAKSGAELAAKKIGQSFTYYGVPGSTMFSDKITEFNAKFNDWARVSGVPEGSEAYKVEKLKYSTAYHSQVVNSMIRTPGFTEKAKEYYDANKTEIDDPKSHLLHQINAADADLAGVKSVDGAWASVMGGTKDYNAPVKSAELYEAIRKDTTLDSKEKRSAAHEEMSRRIGAWNQQQAEFNQAGEDASWKLFNSGKAFAQIKATPQWAQMGGETQGRFTQTYENIQAARAQRALTQLQTADKLLFRKNADSFFRDSDPTLLSQMSREELIAKKDMYGQEATEHLLNKHEALQKKSEGLNVISTEKTLKVNAQQAGFLPKTGTPNANEQDAYNRFELEVARQVKVFEATKLQGKRKADESELQQVIDGVFLNKAKQGIFGSEKPVATLTEKEMKKAYVIVKGNDGINTEVSLSEIPAKERIKLTSALRSNNIPATEQNIATYWIKAGRPK